jgi:hypothetical protein
MEPAAGASTSTVTEVAPAATGRSHRFGGAHHGELHSRPRAARPWCSVRFRRPLERAPGRDAARAAHTGAPGPHGMPSRYHAEKSNVQTIVSATKYGSMRAITVPIPERLS